MFLKWPPMSTLDSDLFWWVWLNILNSNPRPSTNVQFEVISTCFWSDFRGQLWPLTSFGGSVWIFSILTPNHPLMWNLKSFWHVFEVTSEVNFGLWLLLVGQIKYSQFYHPQIWNLKSFWYVFEVTSKVNFGLWPLLVGQIEYSQFKPQTIH